MQHHTTVPLYQTVPPVTYIPAVDLTGDQLAQACMFGATVALTDNRACVILGIDGSDFVEICDGRCCIYQPGALIVVPDVLIAEGVANGEAPPPKTPTLCRDDGRTAYFFRTPEMTAVAR